MLRSIRKVLGDKKGVAALEYSILAGLMVLGVVAAISTTDVSSGIKGVFDNVKTALDNAADGKSTAPTKD